MTALALRPLLLSVDWRLVAQRRMPATPVVESLNEVEDGPPRLARIPEPVTLIPRISLREPGISAPNRHHGDFQP